MKFRRAVLGGLLAVLSACGDVANGDGASAAPPVTPCPRTVHDAASATFETTTFVGTGYVIRFIPSPQTEFRGYEVNVRRSIAGPEVMDTIFLRIGREISGISSGQPVLLVAERTDRLRTVVAGFCPALVPIPDSDVEE